MFVPPNERRNFIHKRLIGAVVGGITGGPGAALAGFAAGGRKRSRTPAVFPVQRPSVAVPQSFGIPEPIRRGLGTIFGASPRSTREQCGARGMAFNTGTGQCTPIAQEAPTPGPLGAVQRFFPGGATGFSPTGAGQALMGRYGAALSPWSVPTTRADCTFGGTVRGMILGDDGNCYNRGSISNKERKWPRGRRPLLTGGEMRAISTAARAAGRLQRTTKRLQTLGMMKKTTRRR